ncbi:hypothetical protein [Devosia indica]
MQHILFQIKENRLSLPLLAQLPPILFPLVKKKKQKKNNDNASIILFRWKKKKKKRKKE